VIHFGVPTTRPRHQVTETPEVAHALDVAERRWPGLSRSALLAKLAEEGARVLEQEDEERRAQRRELVDKHAGGFHFPPNYLDELREDWPE
jgi:hypothetical protein